MFALTVDRFYCFYPSLFSRREFLTLKMKTHHRNAALPFAAFNVGLTNIDMHHSVCKEGCPVVWKSSGLAGLGVMRWGGVNGNHLIVKNQDDPRFSDDSYMWKVDRNYCSNNMCPNHGRSADLVLSQLRRRNVEM